VDQRLNDAVGQDTKVVGAPPSVDDDLIPDSGRLGRFMIIDEAGSGGMGRVYRAYDPQLCREVALKVLRHQATNEAARVRMLREAQGMARISHPNVLPVYDVELHGDALFLVLEYVEGRTLFDYLREERPDWRRTIELFIEAGRGLQAAHDMDLVHRDFKPGNVLVGDDGRVRVMDFGLARASAGETLDEASLDASSAEDNPVLDETDAGLISGDQPLLSSEVTRFGITMGTPAYMAPEQHVGVPLDARCDQFSFCVSLYEGLYGERPYPGRNPKKLARLKRRGQIADIPAARNVPRWAHQAIVRGLSPRRDDRWPSMAALVEDLERRLNPPVVRRVWALVGLLGVVAAGAYALGGEKVEQCTFDDRLDGVWDDARQTEIEAAFAATNLNFATDSWQRVRGGVDEYVDGWTTRSQELCERGQQGPATRSGALQEACLEARFAEASATLALFAEADADVVRGSVVAVSELPHLDPCMDDRALALEKPDPDPGQAEAIEGLEKRLHSVRALGQAGKYEEAFEMGDALAVEAEATRYRPLIAEVETLNARYLDRLGKIEEAEKRLRGAYFNALSGSHVPAAYRAATALCGVVGVGLARGDEGLIWGDHARAHLEALPEGAADEEALETAMGNVMREGGEYDKSRAHFERALAIVEKDRSPNHPAVAAAVTDLGTLAAFEGKYDIAIEHLERALSVRRAALGEQHPDVAGTLNNLGYTYDLRGDWKQARDAYLEAGKVFEAAFGPDHETAGRISMNLAVVHHRQEHYEQAEQKYEEALAVYTKTYGVDHPRHAGARLNLGTLYLSVKRPDDAIEVISSALESFRKAHGEKHPLVADALGNLAEAYREAGRMDEAVATAGQALEMRQSILGDDHPDLAYSHSTFANLALAQNDLAAARKHHEAALRIRVATLPPEHPDVLSSAAGVGDVMVDMGMGRDAIATLERHLEPASGSAATLGRAQLRFALARALDADPKRRGEAKPMAKRALEDLREVAPEGDDITEVRAWLKQ
jgi:tetratricopeptide (TPR) repeat protein/tRNA A-37 threonylcarbamoyl transferase component Bud32